MILIKDYSPLIKTKTLLLQLGSNMGNSKIQFVKAQQHIIELIGNIKNASSLYISAAWGFEAQPDFLNQVIEVETTMPAQKIISTIQGIEEKMGRERNVLYGPRIIDIDILFFNDEIIKTKTLIVPHPLLEQRRFVLEPLKEIVPNFIHPILRKSIIQLVDECTDTLNVQKI